MDRDDIEHLFKNEHGFTFRDRKKFWNILQKIVDNDSILFEPRSFFLYLAIE